MAKNPFLRMFLQYWHRIIGLRDLVRELAPLTKEQDRRRAQEVFDAFSPYLDLPERESAATSSPPSLNQRQLLELLDIFDDAIFGPQPLRSLLLSGSILVLLVSTFELLITELLHQYLMLRPQILASKDKAISWEELVRMSSLDEVMQYVIGKKLDGIMRGGIDEWCEFLSDHNIYVQNIVQDWDSFYETFQRRHIIVHNGGRANTHYLNKVSKKWIKTQNPPIQVGKQLFPSSSYLENRIELFLSSGLLLCDAIWAKLRPDDPIREEVLSKVSYRLLRDSEWRAASLLYEGLLNHSVLTDESRMIFKLNLCLCYKRMGRLESLQEILGEFDLHIVHPRFALAYYALIDDRNKFFECLDQLAAAKRILSKELEEWPILEEMRSDHRFSRYVKRIKSAEKKRMLTLVRRKQDGLAVPSIDNEQ